MTEAALQQPVGRRERRKQEVRERITESTIGLLSEKALEDVTVDEICELADVAKKTFYNHYPSKQELIETISQALLINESENNFRQAMAKFSTTRERLEFFLTRQGMNLSDNETLERNLIKHALLDLSANSQRSRAKLDTNIALFEKMFTAGVEIGDVNDKYDPRFLAEMVDGAINTSAIHWIHYPDYPVNKRFRELKELILDLVIRK
jgi:AcrR family transcriptional regulator